MLDSNGYVVDANGNFVYGFQKTGVDTNGEDTFDAALKPLRVPKVTVDATDPTKITETITVSDKQEDASTSVTIQINNAGIITASVKYEKKPADTTTKPPTPAEYDTKVCTLGKVAIATFQNPNGVSKAGGNYYKATKNDNTGAGIAAAPGDAGTSTLMGGFIESSNVDLAKEFADMITTHRGFQANSKMITVSDEMLSDLVAMKR